MARLPQVSREQLLALVQARGPVSATELAASLGINRTTVVRALTNLGKCIAVFGHTRSTRYAVRRPIRNAATTGRFTA